MSIVYLVSVRVWIRCVYVYVCLPCISLALPQEEEIRLFGYCVAIRS